MDSIHEFSINNNHHRFLLLKNPWDYHKTIKTPTILNMSLFLLDEKKNGKEFPP